MHAPATNIARLRSLLNWRLLAGSHPFPGGPAGGTCFLEAAIVVAGLPYRAVRCSGDAPEDFSRVLAEYLLQLNDRLSVGPRQRLIPFVTRMAGTADTREVEDKRRSLIVEATRSYLLPAAKRAGQEEPLPKGRRARVIWAAKTAALACADPSDDWGVSMSVVIGIVEAALAIGNRAAPVDPLAALVRLERVRPRAPRRAVAVA